MNDEAVVNNNGLVLTSDPNEFEELQVYLKRIKDGVDKVGEKMQLNFAYVIKGLKEKSFFYCKSKAQNCIRFIESQVPFVSNATGLFKLEPWQKYILACMYGLVDEDGLRHFTEFVWIMGRKQGKSALTGSVETYHAFTQNQEGMQIYNLGPKLKQAEIIYKQFLIIAERNKYLARRGKKRRDDYYIKDKNCSVSTLTFNSKKSDGFDPAFAVFDEFAAWEGAKSLDMYNVISSGQGAQKQPINIFCSTANFIDGGLYDEIYSRATAVLKGTSEEQTLLPFIYEIDDLEKWDDPEELRKSLPNLGVSFLTKKLKAEIDKAHQSQSYKAEFITKYCNIKQNATSVWLSAEDIRSSQGDALTPEMFRGMYGTGGVDLSRTTDLTAAVVSIDVDGEKYYLAHFWLPEKTIREAMDRDNVNYMLMIRLGYMDVSGDKVIDYRDVTQWFVDLREKYGIEIPIVGYDRYSAEYWVSDMKEHGFTVDDVYQGTNLTPILRNFEGWIKSGIVHTGTNGLLQSHLSNAALVQASGETSADNRVKLAKYLANKHIDGVAALIDAETVKDKWSEQYKWLFESNSFKRKDDADELAAEAFSIF